MDSRNNNHRDRPALLINTTNAEGNSTCGGWGYVCDLTFFQSGKAGGGYFVSTLTDLSSLGFPCSIWTTLTSWRPSPFGVKEKVPRTP